MNSSDDGLDKVNNQGDQREGRILDQDRDADKQRRPTVYPLEVGWTPRRRPASSFKSSLSVIAAVAKLIVFISLAFRLLWPLCT
jgi:hypothetical protein